MNAIEELLSLLNSGLYSSGACDEDATYRFKKSQVMEMRKIAEKLEAEYMELQKDKNGKVIHVGDRMVKENGDVCLVMGVGGSIFFDTKNKAHYVGSFEHEQPDSMERIEADACKTVRDYWRCIDHVCCYEGCLAPRIHNNCDYAKTLDLIARTEKLLGGENLSEKCPDPHEFTATFDEFVIDSDKFVIGEKPKTKLYGFRCGEQE